MKVVILCGGLGMRLREETEYKPKPMVEIGGRPILWHIMKIYAHYGFKDFVLCLGYKGEVIKEYFLNYEAMNNDFIVKLGRDGYVKNLSRSHEDYEVILADTGLKTMTGGRLKKVQKYIDGEYFMLTYGDGVANIDTRKLFEFHKSHGKIGTITGVPPITRFGELDLEGDKVINFAEKPQKTDMYVNGGFMVFNKEFFKYLNDDESLLLEKQPLENLARDGQLMIFKHQAFWQCMDNYRDYDYLNKLWDSGSPPWKIWND